MSNDNLHEWMDNVEEQKSLSDNAVEISRLKHRLQLSNRKVKEMTVRLSQSEEREQLILGLQDHNPNPVAIKPIEKAMKPEATAVMLASDWHVEELVEAKTINGMNAYTPTIARVRAAEFFRGLLWMIRNARAGQDGSYGFSIKNLVLWLGGDLISGYIHDELMESNELSPTEATLLAQDLIASGIDFLLEHGELEKIVVPCSYGNHGRCHDDQTELLTRDGWRKYDQISIGDLVATYNMESGATEWQPLQDVYIREYEGPMVAVQTKTADFQVTPHHRMVVNDFHTNRNSILLMEEILGKGTLGAGRFPKCAEGKVEDLADVTDDELRLLGWVMTDGCYNSTDAITIYQSKEESVSEIDGLLTKLGMSFSHNTRERDASQIQISGKQVKTARPEHSFYIYKESQKRLRELLPEKNQIPDWCWDLSQRQFGVLLEALLSGDGSVRSNGMDRALYGKKDFLDQVQALALVNGIPARIREDNRGHHVLSLPQSKHAYINNLEDAAQPVQYSGIIWCGTVENGTLITRRNGIPLVSGNTTTKRRHSTGAKNNYEWLMYHQLRRLYKDEPRVEFHIADGAHLYMDIYDWTLRFHHGDDVRYQGGVGGLSIPLRKATDSWNIGRHADITCFPPGTPVIDRFYRSIPIEHVEPGQILAGRGGFTEVRQVHPARSFSGNLCAFSLEGVPDLVPGATPEHPYWVDKSMRCHLESRKDRRCHPDKGMESKPCVTCKTPPKPSPEWVDAKDIQVGDYLAVPVPEIPTEATNAPEHARLLGYYLAEGSICKNKHRKECGVTFTFNQNELFYHEDVANLVSKLFDIDVKSYAKPGALDVRLHSMTVPHWFTTKGGEFSDRKSISEWAWNLDAESRIELLTGWLSGDGYVRKDDGRSRREVIGVTVSKNLATQMYFMALSVGFRPVLRMQPKQDPKLKDAYFLSFSADDAIFFAKKMNRGVTPFPASKTKVHGYFHEGLYFARVTQVREIPYDGPVHNMETSSREYVVGTTLVHNCIGHWHQFFDCNYAVVNGSLVGYNAFALGIKARYEPPMQGFFLMDRDRGKRLVSPVMVDTAQRRMLSGTR